MSRDETSCRGNEDATTALGVVCDDISVGSDANNFCMRDDAFTSRTSEFLYLFPTGCPDHQLGDDELAVSDQSDASMNSAQYQRYTFKIPRSPRRSDGGDCEEGVLGVMVNGVPFVGGDVETNGTDACGGSVDMWHRYMYSSTPVCLLEAMRAVPERNASTWPSEYQPSPLVGYALDGYPVYGPYDNLGKLRREPEFDSDRYYGLPRKLEGDYSIGSVDFAIATKRCALRGLDTAYCVAGVSCALNVPRAEDVCEKGRHKEGFEPIWGLLATFVVLSAYVLYSSRHIIMYALNLRGAPPGPRKRLPALAVSLLSVLGALLLVSIQEELVLLFYQRNQPKIDAYANDALSAFLSVIGVLYALVVAQVLGTAYERRSRIQGCLSEELSSIHTVALLVASLDATTPIARAKKCEVFDILDGYIASVVGEITASHASEPGDISLLFAVVPVVKEATQLCTQFEDEEEVLSDVVSRTFDIADSVSKQRYQRCAAEREGLGILFYALNIFLSNVMYIGVLLIYSGSVALNLTYCFVTVFAIGLTTFMISSLDDPYCGPFKINLTDADVLLELICELRRPHRMSSALQADRDKARLMARNTMDAADPQPVPLTTMESLVNETNDMIYPEEDDEEAKKTIASRQNSTTPSGSGGGRALRQRLPYKEMVQSRLSTRRAMTERWLGCNPEVAAVVKLPRNTK